MEISLSKFKRRKMRPAFLDFSGESLISCELDSRKSQIALYFYRCAFKEIVHPKITGQNEHNVIQKWVSEIVFNHDLPTQPTNPTHQPKPQAKPTSQTHRPNPPKIARSVHTVKHIRWHIRGGDPEWNYEKCGADCGGSSTKRKMWRFFAKTKMGQNW